MQPIARGLAIVFVAAALCGCAGAIAPPSPAPASVAALSLGAPAGIKLSRVRGAARNMRGWLSPQAKNAPLVYVSDFTANAIDIYPADQTNPSPIGQITDGIAGPLGNFVDANGKLYVANTSNNTVTEYPKGSLTPSVTLSNGINGPISVAVDSHHDVAVGEFSSGMILEFRVHRSKPHYTISLPLAEALAFDRNGVLYAAWNQNNGSSLIGQVSKCPPRQPECRNLNLTEGQSGGLTLDAGGDIALGDQTNQAINIYAPNATSPTRIISTVGHDPYKFALDKSEKKLYVADIDSAVVVIYDYVTGVQLGTISTGLESAWGVSLSPAAPYGP